MTSGCASIPIGSRSFLAAESSGAAPRSTPGSPADRRVSRLFPRARRRWDGGVLARRSGARHHRDEDAAHLGRKRVRGARCHLSPVWQGAARIDSGSTTSSACRRRRVRPDQCVASSFFTRAGCSSLAGRLRRGGARRRDRDRLLSAGVYVLSSSPSTTRTRPCPTRNRNT